MQNSTLGQKLDDLTVFLKICAEFSETLRLVLRPTPEARYHRGLGPEQPGVFCPWIATMSAAIGH
jgi:hypothetical protein